MVYEDWVWRGDSIQGAWSIIQAHNILLRASLRAKTPPNLPLFPSINMKISVQILTLFAASLSVSSAFKPACPFKTAAGVSKLFSLTKLPAVPPLDREEQDTLLARLGGKEALAGVVEGFYERLFDDEGLERFFQNQDKEYLMGHQRKLLAQLFTNSFPGNIGDLMVEKHSDLINNLGLDELHFDMVAGHLVATLTEVGAEQDSIDEAVAILSPLRTVFEQAAKKNQ